MKIILIGILWVLSVVTSLKGWYKILIAFISIFIVKLRPYALKIWISDDQDMNAILNGNEDHTISGRVGYMAWKYKTKEWLRAQKIINTLFWFQKNHCYNSIEWDEVE